MDIFILAISLLGLFCISYILFSNDIFSPSVLFTLSYFISVICCLYNGKYWGVQLSIRTVAIIVTALVCFIVGEYIISSRSSIKRNYHVQIKSIKVNRYIFITSVVILVSVTFLLYKDIVRIANISYQEWGSLTYNYKSNMSNLEDASFSPIVDYGMKFCKALSYVYSFIFVNNCFAAKKVTIKNILNLVPLGIIVYQSILKGVRIQILALVFMLVFLFYFFIQVKNNWRWRMNLKYISLSFVGVICVSSFFYLSKGLVGRMQDNISGLTYITTYLGGSVELLNLYIINPTTDSKVIETMSGFVSSLKKLGLFKDYTVNSFKEYRTSPTGVSLGNVYGAVRDYYHDLGFIGVIICTLVLSSVVCFMYYRIKSRNVDNLRNPGLLIIYSTLVYAIFFLTFNDFLTAKLAFGSLTEILFTLLCCAIIIKPKYKSFIRLH